MNRTNMKKLIITIKKIPEKNFSMQGFRHCNSPQCIGGYAAELAGKDIHNIEPVEIKKAAEKYLGITKDEATELFTPNKNGSYYWGADKKDPAYITKNHAVACLEHFIKTGEINWHFSATEYTHMESDNLIGE